MDASRKLTKSLLRSVAWLLFVIAGIALWMGGRSISEFAKTARTLVEMEGIGLAVLFAGLPTSTKYFLQYTLHRWRVVRERFHTSVLVFLLFGATSMAQSRYFPPGSLDDSPRGDQFLYEWYSKQLKALDEPSLWTLSKTQKEQSYRFLWLRTFHHPVSVRIDVNGDGTSRLTTKIASGAGGYAPGHLVQNDTSALTKEQTDWFLGKIQENKFWELAPLDKSRLGTDGAQWIIEGVKNGNYRIVDRWSPDDGPVRVMGLLMLKELAKVKIPAKETY